MVVQQINEREVISLSRRELALRGDAGVHDEAFLAALVRRAAGILCPCSDRTILRAVLESLLRLADDATQLEIDVETAVEKAMIAGDLLEFSQATTGDPSAKGTWVFAAPPSFVARSSGSVFFMGITPDESSPLPLSLSARITYERHFRLIYSEVSENLPQILRELGVLELSEQTWFKFPREEPARHFVDRLERDLMAQPISGSVTDLLILDSARDPSYYKGRWVAPRRETGCFVARRPQAYGAPLWGFAHLTDGALDKFLDFPPRRDRWRGSDFAWHLQPPREPMALIAAEHTAQLNAAQAEDVFSKAEEHELLFQDVLPARGRKAYRATAIDVLSSTTTMEVGIDIGALSGVALRNMPPGRANYQQRAGRAGRRGNAVATVVAFGSADSHDEHYFTEPEGMIRGDVIDPKLTLDNTEITRRHIRAFLLQNYHQDRLPDVDPEQPHHLFSVLGSVSGFRTGTAVLNMHDFKEWLSANEKRLQMRVAAWMPSQLSPEDRSVLITEMKDDCISAIEMAIRPGAKETKDDEPHEPEEGDDEAEETPEEGDERPGNKPETGELLQRLLYRGILPRYAFPTDVATFHVFDDARSTRFRPVMRFAPSQGLPIALSQYAPGKQIWISGKCYSSGAIYSVMSDERFEAWENKRLYCECSACGFARTFEIGEIERGEKQDCPACGTANTFGEARYWLRPPGFAHPIDVEELTSPDDMPETSYATRAKLTMQTPADETKWTQVNERVRVLKVREHLLVSNTGPKADGYSYCVKCGRIEASSEPTPLLSAPHRKP